MTTASLPSFPVDKDGRMLVPVSSIDVSDRLREDLGDIDGLAEDIRTNGLIQPIVITRDLKLIAGGRRYTAMTKVLKMTEVPCVYKETISEVHLRVMEIAENTQRQDLDWKERVMGIYECHKLMEEEKVLQFKPWSQKETARVLSVSRATVDQAVLLAQCIIAQDKDIIACKSARDGLALLVKRKEDAATKRLAELTLPTEKRKPGRPPKPRTELSANIDLGQVEDDGFTQNATKDFSTLQVVDSDDEDPGTGGQLKQETVIPLSSMLFHDDCIRFGNSLPTGYVDHIVTDIPYGIEMANLDKFKDIDNVRQEHDVEENVQLYQLMFPMFYRVLREKGFVVMWYDLDHHNLLKDLAEQAGFTVQRWPLIWCKTHPCRNSAATVNWTKNYEHAMVLRKGNASLVKPQTSGYWVGGADLELKRLGHPFVKPIALWQWIYSAVAIQGQVVFDPFAGVGSSTLAAVQFGLRPLACEKVEEHYSKLIVNVSQKYEALLGKVRFE